MAEGAPCSSCGIKLPTNALMGLCVPCLLKAGITEEGTPTCSEAVSLDLPKMIGPYTVVGKIGEGGMGEVWMAEQTEPIRRKVALKIIKTGLDSKQVLARFEAERQALALMDHPNIAKVLDAGSTSDARPYFAMELVHGIPLTQFCDDHRPTIRERLELFMSVCQAIQHAHQKGVIHRDIKPTNVLVAVYDGKPVPKVIDFGIAKATGQQLTERTLFTSFGMVVGTLEYMSPEQAEPNSLDVDTRSDIYSLGVLLYELLTGTTPLRRESLVQAAFGEVLRRIRSEEPPRPSTRVIQNTKRQSAVSTLRIDDPPSLARVLRGDLDWIAMKALEKDRDRRYETAAGLAADVRRHLANEPVLAGPPSSLYRFRKAVRRNKVTFAAGVSVAVALTTGLCMTLWSLRQQEKATAKERQAKQLATDSSIRAEHAEKEARQEAERAKAAEADAKMTLASADFFQSVRLMDADRASDALAYLERSLFLNPTNREALTQLTTVLAYQSWCIPLVSLYHPHISAPAEISPDGRWILTASRDHTARIWDAQTPESFIELKHKGPLNMVQFDLDGFRVLTASADGTASIWDVPTGRLLRTLRHKGPVNSARFNGDSTFIVTASDDSTARVWDAQTGMPTAPPLKHDAQVNSAQFSPDGKTVITTSQDKTARVWDVTSGLEVFKPLQHGESVAAAQFNADGTRIVTASWDHKTRLWDAQTGSLLGYADHAKWLGTARFSEDGKLIVTAAWDRSARLWDGKTHKPLPTPPLTHGDYVESAEFSPNGQWIVTASRDFTARVWDVQNGRHLAQPLNHPDALISARFSHDGKKVLSASRDGTVRVWDVRKGEVQAEPLEARTGLSAAQFSPDGTLAVSASGDGTAHVWNAKSGKQVAAIGKEEGLNFVQFSLNGSRILTASLDGGNHPPSVWESWTGRRISRVKHPGPVHRAQFSPDGKWVVATSGNIARAYDAETGEPLGQPMKQGSQIESARFSPEGNRLVTASQSTSAGIWELPAGRRQRTLNHDLWVWWADFSPDGQRVVTASADTTARIWDAGSGQLLATLNHRGDVRHAEFSPDSKRVITASDDGTAQIWGVSDGKPIAEPMRHPLPIRFACFSPRGDWIITCSDDKTARLWSAGTDRWAGPPWHYPSLVFSAAFSRDGKRVIPICAGGTGLIWDLPPSRRACPSWLLELAQAISGKALTRHEILQPTQKNPAEMIQKIRNQLERSSGDDDLVIWGRWFLADRSTRTVSPFSGMTVPKPMEDRAQENRSKSGNSDPMPFPSPPPPAKPTGTPTADTKPPPPPATPPRRVSNAYPRTESQIREELSAKRKEVGNDNGDVINLLTELGYFLSNQNQPPHAEPYFREALAIQSKLWTNALAQCQRNVLALANVLHEQGKSNEVERLFADFLTPENMNRPDSVGYLQGRGAIRARQGRWRDGAMDFRTALQTGTPNLAPWAALATLIARTGDAATYTAHLNAMLEQFGLATNSYSAERQLRASLLLPVKAVDFGDVNRLVQLAEGRAGENSARSSGKSYIPSIRPPNFQLTIALAEYRQGLFAQATERLQRLEPSKRFGTAPAYDAQASFLLAMAARQQNHPEEALALLKRGLEVVEAHLPNPDAGHLSTDWESVIVAHVLKREAQGLIQGDAENKPPKP